MGGILMDCEDSNTKLLFEKMKIQTFSLGILL